MIKNKKNMFKKYKEASSEAVYMNEEKMQKFEDSKQKKVSYIDNLEVEELFNIPMLGMANCGEPLAFASESMCGYIKLSPRVLQINNPKGLFIIQAKGYSLNKADINDLLQQPALLLKNLN